MTLTERALERDRTKTSMESREQRAQEGWANVGPNERTVSLAAGAILGAFGLARGGKVGLIMAGVGADMIFRGATGYSPLYQALGWDTRKEFTGSEAITRRGIRVQQSFIINKPAEDLYRFWRDFKNLPRIMNHLERVEVRDGQSSHWVAKVIGIPKQIEWDAQITSDEPNRLIAWRSMPDAMVQNAGEVRFEKALGDRGTNVRVSMSYLPPAGMLGGMLAKMYSPALEGQIREDIRNFKRIMEIGEVIKVSGQSRGTCTGQGKYEA